MAFGIFLGWMSPGVKNFINQFTVGTTNIPIAIGLILMMYPPFAKVRYEDMGEVQQANPWPVAGAELAHRPVPDVFYRYCLFAGPPEYMIGLIMIGWRAASRWSSSGTSWRTAIRNMPPGCRVQQRVSGDFFQRVCLVLHHRAAAAVWATRRCR